MLYHLSCWISSCSFFVYTRVNGSIVRTWNIAFYGNVPIFYPLTPFWLWLKFHLHIADFFSKWFTLPFLYHSFVFYLNSYFSRFHFFNCFLMKRITEQTTHILFLPCTDPLNLELWFAHFQEIVNHTRSISWWFFLLFMRSICVHSWASFLQFKEFELYWGAVFF